MGFPTEERARLRAVLERGLPRLYVQHSALRDVISLNCHRAANSGSVITPRGRAEQVTGEVYPVRVARAHHVSALAVWKAGTKAYTLKPRVKMTS